MAEYLSKLSCIYFPNFLTTLYQNRVFLKLLYVNIKQKGYKMNTQIRSKGVELDERTKNHIDGAIGAFQKFSLDITSITCMINSEKNGVNVEFDIHIAHNPNVVISQSDANVNVAIDLAIDRASKALRRLHDKIVSKKTTSISRG
jgi:putative sigma-54 modulation protein